MTILVIAEHDQRSVKAATLNTLAAAAKLGGDIHVLVAGAGCAAAAAQAVRVVREVLQSHALGTEIPLTEGVGGITADLDDPVVLDRDLQAAGRLAEIAGAVVDRHVTPRGGCP